ncbi:hypothetical protein LTR53_020268, partial [Teratosphaeriaceae sp. CCFEE 6253]
MTADGEGVALQQRDSGQGRHGVEGDRAADVDERQQDGEDARQRRGILRDMPARVDIAQPAGEGNALVAGKGEEVAGDGGQVDDVGRDVQHDDDDEDD